MVKIYKYFGLLLNFISRGLLMGTTAIFFILIAVNVFTIIAALAAVFLGGMLVYKTKYAGQAFLTKKQHIEQGDIYEAEDGYSSNDPGGLGDPNPIGMPNPLGDDETADILDKSLGNILKRHQDFRRQANMGDV